MKILLLLRFQSLTYTHSHLSYPALRIPTNYPRPAAFSSSSSSHARRASPNSRVFGWAAFT